MFCYQCLETARNQGCTVKGVCGKTDDAALLQDVLPTLTKGIAVRGLKEALGLADINDLPISYGT